MKRWVDLLENSLSLSYIIFKENNFEGGWIDVNWANKDGSFIISDYPAGFKDIYFSNYNYWSELDSFIFCI
jgi:hypothetical protein